MEAMNEDGLAPIEIAYEEDELEAASAELATQVETGRLGALPETATESHIARFIFEQSKGTLLWVASGGEQGELAVWTGKRWIEKDRGYRLLDGQILRWCDRLFLEMPAPPPEAKSDYRKKFMEARFQRGVRHLLLTLLAQPGETCTSDLEVFNAKPFLFGMKDKDGTYRVADLAHGEIREMRRDDFISVCGPVMADATVEWKRTARFLDEIALGPDGKTDAELKRFLMLLCALMLTAHPYQGIFFFWGRGRNGKGALLRLMEHILGPRLVGTIRGAELVVSKYDSDRAKRTYNKLEGARIAITSEAVGENLNLQMLKEMTGGDRLASAKMRQDDRTFAPTHKLILPTNERPVLPNDAAFSRTYFVPFRADYSDRSKQDKTMEPTMKLEAPGFLAYLISLCPEVITHINDIPAPDSVREATREVLEENDIAGQFADDMLEATPGKHLSIDAAQQAAFEWLVDSSGKESSGVTVNATQNYHERNKQMTQIISGLKAKFVYKRLRPDVKERGRKVFHFLDVSLKTD